MEDTTSEQLRHVMHELSNLLTGIMVTAGLLQMSLQGDRRQHYASEICEGSERSAALVRETRAMLTPPEDRNPEAAKHMDY